VKAAGFSPHAHHEKKLLITQLQAEAKHLERTPTAQDMDAASKAKRTVSTPTFRKAFGSWNNALQAAGLEVNSTRTRPTDCSRSTLIAQLQNEAKRLKRTPMLSDMEASSKAKRTASPSTFASKFGSWNNALKAAEISFHKKK
jgi:hypothetical protein